MTKLLTSKDVAARLDVSPITVIRLADSGVLPAIEHHPQWFEERTRKELIAVGSIRKSLGFSKPKTFISPNSREIWKRGGMFVNTFTPSELTRYLRSCGVIVIFMNLKRVLNDIDRRIVSWEKKNKANASKSS